jgi:transcriptional/translational regulatory protein YebC/TACO1
MSFINFSASFASGDEDQIMEVALDAGAQDVISNDDGSIDVITTPEDFFTVKDALTQAELEPGHAEVTMKYTLMIAIR